MDTLTLTDVNRMIVSIDHESNNRAKELKLEAIEEYNKAKVEALQEGETELSKCLTRRVAEVENERKRAESNLDREYKLKKQQLKAEVVEQLFDKVQEKLKTKETDPELIDDVLMKCEFKDLFVFCNASDRDAITSHVHAGYKLDFRDLPKEAMGGVIICTKDGKEVWDNSYATRLQTFKDRYLNLLSKELFD